VLLLLAVMSMLVHGSGPTTKQLLYDIVISHLHGLL
jgi:hypothetical protein